MSNTTNSTSTEDAAAVDRQTEAQIAAIAAEIKETQPLTSAIRPMEVYYKERVAHDHDASTNDGSSATSHFAAGCQYLTQHYTAFRSVRGDGNCYYRALLYRLVEMLSSSAIGATEAQRLLTWLQTTSWDQVINVGGYSEFAVETFYDCLVEILEQIVAQHKNNESPKDWHTALNAENDLSDYCTWYLRVLTATHLKAHADRFLPFLEDTVAMDMAGFCQRNVEPMGKECEMVSVAALAEALQIHVVVEYLDGRPLLNDRLTRHEWGPAEAALTVHVLYRPGHYDILYPLKK